MAQSGMAKKSGRKLRGKPNEKSQNASSPQDDAHSPDRQNAPQPVPALLNGSRPETSAEDHKTRLPALVPQRLPALHGEQRAKIDAKAKEKSGFRTIAQALLIGGCVAGALIFSLGALKKTDRNEMQLAPPLAQADAGMSLSPAPVADKAATVEKKTAAVRAARADSRPAAAATGTASTKKTNHARTASQPAEREKKKATATAAKPSKKSPEASTPLLAQNSTTPALAQSGYAQCQELESFLRREQCKWQVCSGKWGLDGCPSYADENRQIN